MDATIDLGENSKQRLSCAQALFGRHSEYLVSKLFFILWPKIFASLRKLIELAQVMPGLYLGQPGDALP